jgi:pyrimidine operon attenuation protein/uracil phosphoribosyltransferase
MHQPAERRPAALEPGAHGHGPLGHGSPGNGSGNRPGNGPRNRLSPAGRVVLDGDAISRTLSRIAHEIIERNEELDSVALVGIHSRGVPLAHRLRRLIAERAGLELELGQLDITFHRDDVHVRAGQAPRRPQPVVRDTKLDFELEGRTVILVDDVLYTGRTIRAAIDALFEYGRPARVQLAVLADRGHRELPIRPDYVGKNLPTARNERIQVQVVEVDEIDQVILVSEAEEGPDTNRTGEEAQP